MIFDDNDRVSKDLSFEYDHVPFFTFFEISLNSITVGSVDPEKTGNYSQHIDAYVGMIEKIFIHL